MLLRRQRDLSGIRNEVIANLEAIRAAWADPNIFRWNRLGQTLSVAVWRSCRYPVTDPLQGPALDENSAIVRELDALAAEFDHARHQQSLSSDWESRLLALADELAHLLTKDHRRRWWNRAFTARSRASELLQPERAIVTPSDPAELQRKTRKQMRERIEGASNAAARRETPGR